MSENGSTQKVAGPDMAGCDMAGSHVEKTAQGQHGKEVLQTASESGKEKGYQSAPYASDEKNQAFAKAEDEVFIRRSGRNWAIFISLIAFVLLVFILTIVKIQQHHS